MHVNPAMVQFYPRTGLARCQRCQYPTKSDSHSHHAHLYPSSLPAPVPPPLKKSELLLHSTHFTELSFQRVGTPQGRENLPQRFDNGQSGSIPAAACGRLHTERQTASCPIDCRRMGTSPASIHIHPPRTHHCHRARTQQYISG